MNSKEEVKAIEEKISKYFEKVEKEDRRINAFIQINKKIFDDFSYIKKNKEKKNLKLFGKVIAVKSNINVRAMLCSCASKTLENYYATYDADVIKRIKESGALIIGMTNMDEFACGSSGETSYYGATQNPALPDKIPGGSSSGSAAAVAANFCDAALGSDTGGSIRNPASHCGVLGIKPTYGLVSRHGLVDLAMSLDQIGCFARDVKTLAPLLEIISGKSEKDATTVNARKQNYSEKLSDDIKGIKVGYAKEFSSFTDESINKVIIDRGMELLKELGAEIKEISIPDIDKALPTYYLINFVEFFSATRKFDGRRYGYRIEEVCGEEVRRRIEIGRYISKKEYAGKYYKKALKFRAMIREELLRAFKNVDVIVSATVPKAPHKIGEKLTPMEMYSYDVLTTPANLAGIPAASMPIGRANSALVGMQIQAKPWEEQKILNTMYAVEKAISKHGESHEG